MRQSIRDIATKESKLVDSIGTAHMEQEIQKRVLKLAREQEKTLEEQTGVELQQQVEEENIQDYMAEVFAEVQKSRKKQKE